MFPPERIVCLTEETVETLYLLGEERRIVGVSGYTVRPARARREKPRVSAFISADFDKILALEPDLVLTFSDLQADIAAELIRRNVAVHAFNQRDVAGILAMIRTLGALVDASGKADALTATLARRLEEVHGRAAQLPRHPRVYFEEWDEPMISGIGWVAELVEIAGGIDVFPARSKRKNAKDRVVSGEELIAAAPDIIVGSWCGKKFVPAKVAAGLYCNTRGARRLPARDQIGVDPAAGTGGAHRRARRARNHHRAVGQHELMIAGGRATRARDAAPRQIRQAQSPASARSGRVLAFTPIAGQRANTRSNGEATMKRLISAALWLVSNVAVGTAWAQPYAPNEMGVTMGHWHLNSVDVEASKKIFVGMGGTAIKTGVFDVVRFPGVIVMLNLRPPT
jgi:iron complex transport system substrate-binding protein